MQLKKAIALFLCLLLCMQVLTGSVFATDANVKSISGGGVKVVFDEATATIALYKVDGENELQMSHSSTMGYRKCCYRRVHGLRQCYAGGHD